MYKCIFLLIDIYVYEYNIFKFYKFIVLKISDFHKNLIV